MNKNVLFVVPALLALTTLANAQTAHGISKKPLSPEQVAIACEKGDPSKLLNTTCKEIVTWLNANRPGLEIKDPAALAVYIRTLTEIPCPAGKHALNREVKGKILREKVGKRWERTFAEGEVCLYDNNRAEVQFSLSCWNSPFERLTVTTAMPAPTPEPVVETPPPTPAPTPVETTKVPTDINVHVDGKVEVVHSGKIEVVHSGEVNWKYVPPPPASVKKPSKCGPKCKFLVGVGIGIGAGTGAYFGTRKDGQPGPGVVTNTATAGPK